MPFARNPTEPDDRAPFSLASALLLTLTLLWCIYWFVHAWRYYEDDGYIHLEFARSLAAGRGFAFNGAVVAGDTAPLWVFLLVAMHALIPNWLIAGKVLAALGAAFGLAGAYAFARRLAAQLLPSQVAIFPAAMLLLIVANPYFCYWAFSGMEPLAAAGLGFFSVLAVTRQQPSTTSFLAGCLLAGIAPLMRPEMFFLSAIVALLLLAQWIGLPGRRSASPRIAALLAGTVLIAGPLIAWSVYSLHAFGHIIPNTNAAKRAGPNESVIVHLLGMYSLGFPLILCGLIAGIAYLVLRPSAVRRSIRNAIASAFATALQPSRSLPLAAWVFILWPACTTLLYIANRTHVQTRYILVTAPSLTIVIMMCALLASRRIGRIAYSLALLAALAVSVVTVRPFIRNKGIDCDVTRKVAFFLRDHIPTTAPVAVYSIGQIAFDSQHPIIDTGGITRPGAIPYLNTPPDTMLRWARSEGAQYYITKQPGPNAVLVFSADEKFIGWTYHPSLYSTSTRVELWKLAPP